MAGGPYEPFMVQAGMAGGPYEPFMVQAGPDEPDMRNLTATEAQTHVSAEFTLLAQAIDRLHSIISSDILDRLEV